ncbi:hypothetical protein EYB25_003053 [Talaromyces marneffei]|uniref:3'-5' exonuclease/helicase (Wrn), putative n=2 Tax=Talaromyces marneffei TaxID=37727 RepID=B6Q8L3_TALMQ|nr:uncharacterized protein EYB26_005558 [Talaromyces marneffei]EEA25817.1 3'-5' exonuclease/helicase (Wrn), putative [Talaromyces marneffei ATCC 18224]KAE8554514.1 hypothetical protein EYB25_003053 [Talaromyces marneffei]QGA17882.1 hypothetical protein EYB26_005558 [Talaromyces marneffei]
MFPSRLRPLRGFDQLLKIGDGTRQFSACAPKRSDGFDGFDEEDEDDITSSSSEMSRVVRQRRKIAEARARKKSEQEQALIRRREELQNWADLHANELRDGIILVQNVKQNFESMRRYAEDQRRAHEKWMKRYEQVIASSVSSVNVGSQSLEEYFLIKYPEFGEIESYISNNVMFIQHCETEVSNCRHALQRIRLASRRINLEMQLNLFATSLGLLAERLSDNHVTPIASAKRNVEKILEPLDRFHSRYIQLQYAGLNIGLATRDISLALKEIAANIVKGRFRLEAMRRKISDSAFNLTSKLHNYRATKRVLRWSGPLGKTHIYTMVQHYYDPLCIFMLASDMKMDFVRLYNEIDSHGIPSLLAHWYLHRWKEGAPRSVDLDIAWRHLDIYYPFHMLNASTRNLRSEVFRLQKIFEAMGNSKSKSKDFLTGWKKEFDVMRGNFLNSVEASSYYTWIRLETEDKVTRLGGVPSTIAQGLFTPKDPISSDLRRFFLYIDAMGSVSRAMNLEEAVAKFDNERHPTVFDTIKLMDYSPSSKREIQPRGSSESRYVMPKKATTIRTPSPIRATRIGRHLSEAQPPARTKESWTARSRLLALINKYRTKLELAESTNPKPNALATASRRGYCTDSRVFMNDDGQQCGVSEPEIALIQKDQIVQVGNKDAAISLVSDAEPSGIMSSHVVLDNSDEPPIGATGDSKPQFWSYNQYKTPDGRKIGIHYCKNLEHAERAAALFSDSKLLGFDIEWKPQAQTTSGIKSNVSLIQIANEERIALFHIALFKGNEIHDLVPPSLKLLLESTDTVKVGVSIKADCSRIRRHLDIDTRGQFELSHLYKLVKYGSTQPKSVNRRAVNLAQQVEELLGLPLRKDSDVRKSDWTKPLDYAQVQYAASDAYACICLYNTLEAKRKALNPIPPLPAFAELNLPILLAEEDKGEIEDEVAELSVRMKVSLELVETGEEDAVAANNESKSKNLDPA